jgi:coenzyme F420 hydrogenase subunit gamma
MQVNETLCVGCGQCALACEAGAILCQWGRAQIDDRLCISCGVCVEYCPVDALIEETK